jgi:tetratricopeptide (TPR) repeat protein
MRVVKHPQTEEKKAINSNYAKTDFFVALAGIAIAGIVVFSVTREEAFFAPKKTPAELEAKKHPGGKVKNGGLPLGDPSLPANVNQAFDAYNRANLAITDGQHKEAIELFKKACELDPIRKIYWSALGSAYTNDGDHEAARKAYLEVYQRDVYDLFNLTSLGYAAQALRNDREARRYYLMALTIRPDLPEGWQEMYNVVHGMSLSNFYQPVQAMVQSPGSIENIDLVYRINQTALEDDPSDYFCMVNRAMMKIRALRLSDAQDDVTKALKLQPLGPGVLLAQADIYNKAGQTEKAISAYRALLKLSPQPVAYAELGELEMQLGQTDQALHDFGKATELGNDKPAWLDTYNMLRDQRAKRIDQENAAKAAAAKGAAPPNNLPALNSVAKATADADAKATVKAGP